MGALHLARKASVNIRKLRGSYPLLNAIRRLSYGRGIVEVADFDGDLRPVLDLGEHMASQIFWFGYYSGDIVSLLKQHLGPGDVFIDGGGANIGEITLVAAKCVDPTGRVVSFEPVAGTHDKLLAHVQANRLEQVVTVLKKGLSDAEGVHDIYAAANKYADGSDHTGLVTMYETAERGALVGSIELTTIDRVVSEMKLDRLTGIKLDIEGAELPAIRGTAESIARFKPWLIVEIGAATCHAAGYEPADVLNALPGYSFKRLGLRGRHVPISADTLIGWQNVLCVPTG